MQPILYTCHRFPPAVIHKAVWLYFQFTLSYRDMEELLAERGLDISYETIRRWALGRQSRGTCGSCGAGPVRAGISMRW
jgi:transposase-like protein